jgi:hypothetical protein
MYGRGTLSQGLRTRQGFALISLRDMGVRSQPSHRRRRIVQSLTEGVGRTPSSAAGPPAGFRGCGKGLTV